MDRHRFIARAEIAPLVTLSNLPIEHLNRRLRLDDKEADQHADGHEQPLIPRLRQRAPPSTVADRAEADVHAAKEQHQPGVCIRKADHHAPPLPLLVAVRHHLEDWKNTATIGRSGHRHLRHVMRAGRPQNVSADVASSSPTSGTTVGV